MILVTRDADTLIGAYYQIKQLQKPPVFVLKRGIGFHEIVEALAVFAYVATEGERADEVVFIPE